MTHELTNSAAVKIAHFFRVTTASAKLDMICRNAHRHFYQKEAIIILAPSKEAALYVDQLLWKHPTSSFLPHVIAEEATCDLVAITTAPLNVNGAKIAINLCPTLPAHILEYVLIYDMLDLSHPEKEVLSQKRQEAYRTLGYKVEEVTF